MSEAAAPRALYRRVLGEAFERLPPALQEIHGHPRRPATPAMV